MNAVLQQLYMIPPVRRGILDVEEPAKHLKELEEEENRKEKEREANRRNREEVKCSSLPNSCCNQLICLE